MAIIFIFEMILPPPFPSLLTVFPTPPLSLVNLLINGKKSNFPLATTQLFCFERTSLLQRTNFRPQARPSSLKELRF